ncbi:outer membrane protein transport protein [Pontibacter sp. G13]|uniref:OmpP1/FadL family transporter n=1 Tax=Pontibacter sp. G13 TaxID=3074898 RepID=UPI002889B4F5|nr:outer membrane protein transport protein [Pontibacter sp. G13]WNJ21540.1 outer membrane protein transport protein [Pontibacter sp. G13]
MRLVCWLALGLFCFIHTTHAGGIKLSLLGQRQQAMGFSGTALYGGASSLWYNPGALPFTRYRVDLEFGFTASRPATTYLENSFSREQVETDTTVLTPVTAYAAWRGKKGGKWEKWSLGLGVFSPFGILTRWPDDWEGKFVIQDFTVNTLYAQPTIAYQLTDQMGFGVGFTYALANMGITRALQVDGANGSVGAVDFSGVGQGFGANVGWFARINPKLALGIKYQTPVKIKMPGGTARFTVPESLVDQYPEQEISTDLPLPGMLHVGLSYQAEDLFLITFDMKFTQWQTFDSLNIELEEPVPNLLFHPERNFQPSRSFHLGGEYAASSHIWIRGGTYYDSSPVPEDYVSPDIPDADRIGVTLGGGFLVWKTLYIDLSGGFEFTGERTARFQQAQFSGIYESRIWNLGLGIRYGIK